MTNLNPANEFNKVILDVLAENNITGRVNLGTNGNTQVIRIDRVVEDGTNDTVLHSIIKAKPLADGAGDLFWRITVDFDEPKLIGNAVLKSALKAEVANGIDNLESAALAFEAL